MRTWLQGTRVTKAGQRQREPPDQHPRTHPAGIHKGAPQQTGRIWQVGQGLPAGHLGRGEPCKLPHCDTPRNTDEITRGTHFKCTAVFTKEVAEIPKDQEWKARWKHRQILLRTANTAVLGEEKRAGGEKECLGLKLRTGAVTST